MHGEVVHHYGHLLSWVELSKPPEELHKHFLIDSLVIELNILEAVTLADSSKYGSVLRTHRLTRDYEVMLALAPLTLEVCGLGEHGFIKPHNLAVFIDGSLHILAHR